jgi:hypothetical protein
LRENGHPERSAAYEMAHFAAFISLQTMHIEGFAARSWAFRVANGSTGSDIFPSKQRFSEMVNGLGYHAPRSIRIGTNAHLGTMLERVHDLDDRLERFCKPANGARGRGAHIAATPEAALAFIASQSEPYLVQSFEKPIHDWRYIYHKDVDQSAGHTQGAWRVMFKVSRPVIVGDGRHGVADLVAQSESIPPAAKHKYLSRHPAINATPVVPALGEVVELAHTGNRAQGAYRTPHSLAEERNLDRFMAKFIADIETALGIALRTVCVDLGNLEENVLQNDYNEERLKDHIVFYEYQLPFGMLPYLQEMLPSDSRWGSVDRLLPTAYRHKYIESQVYLAFMRSVIRSGQSLRSP